MAYDAAARTGWTEERVDRLKALWQEGKSGSEIATALGGVSRNAVIGKLHRLRLGGGRTPSRPVKPVKTRGTPQTRKPLQIKKPKTPRPAKVSAPKPDKAAPKPKRIPLDQLERGQCKWSVTDGDPHLFCGHQVKEGSPYCAYHAAKAVTTRKRMTEQERLARRYSTLRGIAEGRQPARFGSAL